MERPQGVWDDLDYYASTNPNDLVNPGNTFAPKTLGKRQKQKSQRKEEEEEKENVPTRLTAKRETESVSIGALVSFAGVFAVVIGKYYDEGGQVEFVDLKSLEPEAIQPSDMGTQRKGSPLRPRSKIVSWPPRHSKKHGNGNRKHLSCDDLPQMPLLRCDEGAEFERVPFGIIRPCGEFLEDGISKRYEAIVNKMILNNGNSSPRYSSTSWKLHRRSLKTIQKKATPLRSHQNRNLEKIFKMLHMDLKQST